MIKGAIALATFNVAVPTGFVAELPLVGVAMRVAARAITLAVLQLDL